MAFPASAVPSGNSYSVHFQGAPVDGALSLAAAATAALLQSHKVDVRQHVEGDSPEASARRLLVTRAGGKASAFSPAPAPEVPGEGFWKTSLAVVRAGAEGAQGAQGGSLGAGGDFWWPPRADKKVEWDCLLVALREDGSLSDGTGLAGLSTERLAHPDLWIAAARDGDPDAEEWVCRGAGAAVVITPTRLTWASRNATFGRSAGGRALTAEPGTVAPSAATRALDRLAFSCAVAGLVTGMFEDLLGDNLFDKSWVRVDRDDLEARPLRLARACATGAAAAEAARETAPEETPERLLHKAGDLTGRVRARLAAARRLEFPQGEPKPWGSKGRK